MHLTFAGAGAAFTVGTDNYHSNMVLTVTTTPDPTAKERPRREGQYRLLIDCGSDARYSLPRIGIAGPADLDAVYISHLHADHVGGLEWLGLISRYGVPRHRIALYCSEHILPTLWNGSLVGGLGVMEEGRATLSSYFDVHPVGEEGFVWSGIEFQLVPVPHVGSSELMMQSFGLTFTVCGVRVYLTTDTKFDADLLDKPYAQQADIIFHDCETGPASGVHSHYSNLCTLPLELRRKIWLYHYNPGPLPDALAKGFRGVVVRGQRFDFTDPQTLLGG